MNTLTLASDIEELIPIAAMVVGGVIAVVWIIMATIDSTVKAKQKEATRRELAAYVAEGSMTAADAANIINAGRGSKNAAGATDFNASANRG